MDSPTPEISAVIQWAGKVISVPGRKLVCSQLVSALYKAYPASKAIIAASPAKKATLFFKTYGAPSLAVRAGGPDGESFVQLASLQTAAARARTTHIQTSAADARPTSAADARPKPFVPTSKASGAQAGPSNAPVVEFGGMTLQGRLLFFNRDIFLCDGCKL